MTDHLHLVPAPEVDPPPGGRRTDTRADTYEIIRAATNEAGWAMLSNRDIQERLSLRNIDITLPAVSARLRSLEAIGSIEVQYSAHHGVLQREIRPILYPKRPQRVRTKDAVS